MAQLEDTSAAPAAFSKPVEAPIERFLDLLADLQIMPRPKDLEQNTDGEKVPPQSPQQFEYADRTADVAEVSPDITQAVEFSSPPDASLSTVEFSLLPDANATVDRASDASVIEILEFFESLAAPQSALPDVEKMFVDTNCAPIRPLNPPILGDSEQKRLESKPELGGWGASAKLHANLQTLSEANIENLDDRPSLDYRLISDSVENSGSAIVLSATAPNSLTPSASDDPTVAVEHLIELLQELLLGSELAEVRESTLVLERKLEILQHQIYEPEELLNLLMPIIANLLSRKVEVSRDEICQTLVPIIDEVIQKSIKRDGHAMSMALASVIPAAISQQIREAPAEIAKAIAPEMGAAIKQQIVLERDAMVDALYPVIGDTISKYLAEAIRAINEKVANTLSMEGIQRKIRAKVQGVSEAELIFREAMPFTIQAIFLIHKSSGLVIAEVQRSDGQQLESEMVAGMLTAIRSFANDCIVQPGHTSELAEIDYSNSKIILEVAGYCYLAVVAQGELPQRLIAKIRQALGQIIQRYSSPIESFDGDPDTIPESLHPILRHLMEEGQPNSPTAAKSSYGALVSIGLVALGLILIPWGIYQYRYGADRRLETQVAMALASAPDLAFYPITPKVNQKTLKLTGQVPNEHLRQRAAQVATMNTPGLTLNNRVVAMEMSQDQSQAAAEVRRIAAIMNQMTGVAISTRYTAGRVTVEGTVSRMVDATRITQSLEQVPGVRSVSSTLKFQPFRIETRFYFNIASAEIVPLDRGYKIQQIKSFLDQNPEKSLQIIGHSSPASSPLETQTIALQRARTVEATLLKLGVDPLRLKVSGTTDLPTGVEVAHPLWLSRCVEFVPIAIANQSPSKMPK